jgi:hypothetical protein
MELFSQFHDKYLDIKRLNYGIITLLPKSKESIQIQQFRPICLLNCVYKWFTKVVTLMLEPIAESIIHRTQAAFIGGRDILNNILALHEILFHTRRKGLTGIILN